MAEEEKIENVNDKPGYVEALLKEKASLEEALKAKGAEYEKVVADNTALIQSMLNGDTPKTEEETPVDIDKLRKELFDVDNPLSNLEYVTKAIELRDALIANGERDPFLPYGQNISPTEEDIRKANNAAEVFKHCIEYADGDSEVFTNELQRLTDDAMPAKNPSKSKKR